MNSRQFHQAGMKKCQARKDEMQCRRQYRSSGISLWHSEIFKRIAKFSQGLRKFRNGSENFAILAKFRYGQIFAMIAKFRYIAKITVHSEIQIFAMPTIFAMIAKFRYHSESYCA